MTGTEVKLPTGDMVQLTTEPSGQLGAIVRPVSDTGLGGLFYTLSIDGQLYVVPATAVSGFASQWAASAFNVTRLAGDATPPAPHKSGTSGAYMMRTLTINATNIAGQAANDVPFVVLNVDNMSTYARFGTLQSGLAKLSVPQGHYCVIGFFTDYDSQTGSYAERIVTDPEITVSQGSDQAITLNEQNATSKLTVNTPQPSTLQTFTATVFRSDALGNGASFGFTMSGNENIYVQPAELPGNGHGSLQFTDYFRLAAPDGSYTYDLEFPSSGAIPADTDYTVTADQLADVDTTYKADVSGRTESEQRMSWLPWQAADVQAADPPLTTPVERNEYITGDSQIDWQQTLTTLISPLLTAGQSLDSYRTYTAGEQLTDIWRGGPVHPSVQYDFHANPGNYFACPACREGNTMNLAIYPFGDNTPGHVTLRDFVLPGGGGVQESTDFKVYTDGSLYAETTQAVGSLAVPAGQETYQFVYDNTRSSPWWTLSTDQQTTWTFTSSAADGTGTLPSGWYCDASLGTNCGIIPLLFPYLQLPTDDLGELSPGTVTVPFTVQHIQNSSTAPVTASLQVSYDGGTTWQDVPTTDEGGGQFSAQLTVPAPGQTDGFGALRVSAAATGGSQVSQTVLQAFAVTGSAAIQAAHVSAAAHAAHAAGAARASGTSPLDTTGQGDPQPACTYTYPVSGQVAHCDAIVEPDPSRPAGSTPAGYGPADLQDAYKLTSAAASQGQGQTVAVVDAYNDPSAEADLAVYRATYGLPPCSTASGCLDIVNQNGVQGEPPPDDSEWGLEISLDLDMVSAICPNCHILLVEANSDEVSDLAAAEQTAATLGGNAISNSYGTDEFTGMDSYSAAYNQPGHFITAASGDYGFGITEFPAVLTTVTAVGGTTLTQAGNSRGWTETAWGNGANSDLAGGAGSGCSAYVAKPAWQHDGHCHMREVADVSAVADPATGVAAYDSYGYSGWQVVGGTSAAAPIIASTAALAGNTGTVNDAYIYQHSGALFDVIGGSNGSCYGDYHCTGTKGYDGPTGLGTPDGTGAF